MPRPRTNRAPRLRAPIFIAGAACCAVTIVVAAGSFDLVGMVRVGGRPEPNAIVWLVGQSTSARSEAVQQKRVVLDQRNSSFYPHVLAVRVGTTVDVPNDDRVFHNVFSFRDGKRFDLGLYPVGTTRQVTFDQPGLSRVFCNIHPNMAAYVMAVDTPYFSVSDENGRFEIGSVLTGVYTYHAWKPSGGQELTGSVALEAGNQLDLRWP
jgi:plastocyanin